MIEEFRYLIILKKEIKLIYNNYVYTSYTDDIRNLRT